MAGILKPVLQSAEWPRVEEVLTAWLEDRVGVAATTKLIVSLNRMVDEMTDEGSGPLSAQFQSAFTTCLTDIAGAMKELSADTAEAKRFYKVAGGVADFSEDH